MPTYVKQDGSWVKAEDLHVKEGGSYVKANAVWIKVGGEWVSLNVVGTRQSVTVSEAVSTNVKAVIVSIGPTLTAIPEQRSGINLVSISTNDPPSADLVGDQTASQYEFGVEWDASGSTDPDGDTLEYRFDWTSDGTYDTVWSTQAIYDHDYGESGTYTATVQVRDGNGGTDTASESVSVLGSA